MSINLHIDSNNTLALGSHLPTLLAFALFIRSTRVWTSGVGLLDFTVLTETKPFSTSSFTMLFSKKMCVLNFVIN